MKGLAPAPGLVEATGLGADVVAELLPSLEAEGLVQERSGRIAGWSLTAAGRDEAARLLAAEQATPRLRAGIEDAYRRFLALNQPFKALCTAWQVRDLDAANPDNPNPEDMVLNDHTDAAYDAEVVGRLGALNEQAVAVTTDLGEVSSRFGRYGPRMSDAYRRVGDGDHRWFTTPLIGSYHDVWMELHEDLLVTLGIERREGTT